MVNYEEETHLYNLEWASTGFGWVTGKNLPMIEDALWESLSSGVGTKISGESKGFVYRQVSLDNKHRGTGNLQFFENVTTSTIQHTVYSTNGYFGALEKVK